MKNSFFSSFASLLIVTGSLLADQAPAENWQDTWNEPGTTDISYQILGFETSQGLVQLHDGSKWQVFPGETVNMAGWRKGDSIVIEIDFSWEDYRSSRPHTYHLINLTNNSKVSTHLIAGPSSNYLVFRGPGLCLDDGSCWQVTLEDGHLLQNWKADDIIILGRVRRGNWSLCGNVLINVTAGNYIRVKKLT